MSDTLALQPHRRIVFEQTIGELGTFSYLMGNTKPTSIDVSGFTALPVRCLFLGSGDMRHALHLIHTSSHISQWDMHLVDINPAVVARNLLFLQALQDKNVPGTIIWSIWYEYLLDPGTNKHLQKLICTTLASGLEQVREVDRPIIIDTLLSWLHFTITDNLSLSCMQRKEHLRTFLMRNSHREFDDFINDSCQQFTNLFVNISESKLQHANDEIRLFIREGVTTTTDGKVHINATMLQPSTGRFTGHYDMTPFHSYFPFDNESEVKIFDNIHEDEPYPLQKYCAMKFEEWIHSYRARSTSIAYHLWCGDALNLVLFHMSLLEFDLIHTSNLADHIGLLDILVTCMPLLRHRSSSCILTQALRWWSVHDHCLNYLQNVFNGIDIAWFPSLFGLKVNHARDSQRHYILPKPTNTRNGIYRPFSYCDYQIWYLAMGMHIRSNTVHRDTLDALDSLAERCFYPKNTEINACSGLAVSTTLTYYLLLRQYAKRCYIRSDQIFEYLFNRTCLRHRAYATGLQALHNLFVDGKNIHTYREMLTPRLGVYFKPQSHLPMLQLLIIDDIDHNSINRLLETKSIDLTSGKLRSFASSQNFSFHLIDNITFKLDNRTQEGWGNNTLQSYTLLAENATLEFILPSSDNKWKSSHALLIDAHSWYPFAEVSLSSPILLSYPNVSFAMNVRDAICSCFANPMDRNPVMIDKTTPTNIKLINAYETKSDYHLVFTIGLSKDTMSLLLMHLGAYIDESSQSLVFLIGNQICGHYPIDFPCPLQWYMRPMEYEQSGFHIMLPKDTAELLSKVVFNRNMPIFDRQEMKPWPRARRSNGKAIHLLNREECFSLPGGDVDTSLMQRAFTNTYSWQELANIHFNSQQNIDYQLRLQIHTMCFRVFLSHVRVFQFMKQHEQQTNLIMELVIIVDGVYRRGINGEEPYLPLVYLDTRRHNQNNNKAFKDILKREIKIQAKNIAKMHGSSRPLDNEPAVYQLDWNEVSLLRKLLKYNSKNMTTASKQHRYPSPWKASYLELLYRDSRGIHPSIPSCCSQIIPGLFPY